MGEMGDKLRAAGVTAKEEMESVDDRDPFQRILDALYDAMLDGTRWRGVSAMIDEACGLTGNGLMVRDAPLDDGPVVIYWVYCRGHPREEDVRDYIENYHPTDERAPRVRKLPDGHLAHTRDLYTPEELKTSPTYNELLARVGAQNALQVRLDGPDGSSIVWHVRDPVDAGGWGTSRITMVTGLLPHIRQFVRVRQALVRAEARASTVSALLDNARLAVIHLDRRGRILEANDRARGILRRGDGLSDRDGMLRARAPAEQVRLERLMGGALPSSGSAAISGSMLLRRSSVLPPFVVHVKPVSVPQPDYAARHVAALVLVVEPGRQHRIAPDVVATALELTPAESRVAVWLAEGRSVREMAEATGNTESAIYWHLKRIYRKQSLSGQADLVRLVLSLAEFE